MASVETYATIVERERYGKDVRQAIADGLRFVAKYTKKVLKITIYPSDWFVYDTKIDGIETLNLYGANVTVKGIMKDETVQLIKIQPVDDDDKAIYEDYDIKCVAQDANLLMFRTKEYKTSKPNANIDIYVYTELLEPGVQGQNSVEYAEAIDTELDPDSGLPVANRTLYEKFRSCQKKSFIQVNDLSGIFDVIDGFSIEGNLVKNMNIVQLNCILTANSDSININAYDNILEFQQEMTKYGRFKPSTFTMLPTIVQSGPELEELETGEITKVGNYYNLCRVKRSGGVCVLEVGFSTSTDYTQLPQNEYVTIARLTKEFRPAVEIIHREHLGNYTNGTITQAIQIKITTAGEVQAYNFFNNRSSIRFTIPYTTFAPTSGVVALEYNAGGDGIYSKTNLKHVQTLKICANWSIEEYVDYEFDNAIDVDISTILPDFVRDDVEFIIAEQNSEDGDPSEDEPEEES